MFGSKSPIGVDIGSHTIKVCQVKRTGDTYELEKFGAVEIYPSGERPADALEQQAAKVEALKKALAVAGIKAKHAVSAVSGESIIVRYLQLPEMPEDELKKALQWEAEEYIPFRLSEVNLDSVILGRVNDGDHPKMDVLLVSAKKELVEGHLAILRGAGLEPKIVDVDSFAFLNCFEMNHQPTAEECVALVNIGAEITSINIYNNSVSRFSRDIPIGGNTITNAIKTRLGCAFRDAEEMKISMGVPMALQPATPIVENNFSGGLLDSIRGSVEEMTGAAGTENSPEGLAGKAINQVVGNLLSEVRRSLEFFESQYRGLNVGRVVLGGGTAMLRGLNGQFEQELRLPVELLDPLRRIRLAGRGAGEQAEMVRHQLGVGIGLGIRGVAA